MPLNQSDQQPIVDTHNTYRSDPAVKAPNLVWDSTLAKGAQDWADSLAANHQFQHSPPSSRQGLGENIASATTGTKTAAQMADMWGTQEKPNFKPGIFPNVTLYPGSTDPNKQVGHYTQVIWGATTNVGCGIATDTNIDPKTGKTTDYLVCRYSPQGNVSGVGVPYPQPVTLAQVSWEGSGSGASSTPGGTVWQFACGVDAANNVYYFTSNDGGTTWSQTQITGKQMKMVSLADDLTLCGLDTSGAIWQCSLLSTPVAWPSTSMGAAPGSVTFVSVSCGSSANIWAVGTDTYCYQNTGSGWTKMAYLPGAGAVGGPLISTAADGTTWWCDNRGMPARYTGSTWDWSVSSATGWTVTQLSCGSSANVWVIGNNSQYYKLAASGTSWTLAAPGTGKQVSVASDGTAWSIGTDNRVYRLVNNAWTMLGM